MQDVSGLPVPDPITAISQDMKTLIKKIQELRYLDIEDSKIVLPKICVVGDQSTGKSSLIEGMSDIKVPRSAGTCTRCPMEINLSECNRDESWSCKIYLCIKYSYHPGVKIPKEVQSLGPWIEQDRDEIPFITITDKNMVQEALKWAQLAVLNPRKPWPEYVPGQNEGTDDNAYNVKFSPNIIRVDISAPGFPNLSFYDLPGVITQTEDDGDGYMVLLVRKLVKNYISQENCIVILTHTMTDDATNSSAAGIIRGIKGAKKRTLGVLTKPDRIQEGESYDQWRDILDGQKFSLGHGYYVVKNNPNPIVGHSQARREEDAFFDSPPWSSELSDYRGRFGTRRLQTALSHLLLEQIQGCLPRVIAQIDEKAAEINAELQTLPNPPCENMQFILSSKLAELREGIKRHIDGGSEMYPLQRIWRHICQDFKRALVSTRPAVNIMADSDQVSYKVDSDCEVISQTLKRKSPGDGPDRASAAIKRDPDSPPYYSNRFEKYRGPAKVFTWEEIRDIHESTYRAGLPDQTDPRAIESLNKRCVEHWNGPMEVFLGASHKSVRDTLMGLLRVIFQEYHQTSLYRELRDIVHRYLKQLQDEHSQYTAEIFKTEHSKPFTMANDALETYENEAYRILLEERHRARAVRYLDLEGQCPHGDPRREKEIKKVTAEHLGTDQFAREVKTMAVSPSSPVPAMN